MADETGGAAPDGDGDLARGTHPHRAHEAVREWKDAITVRATLLVLGVLGLVLAFAVSYIGGLHHPKPYHVDLAVAAPAPVAGGLVTQLNGLPGEPLSARRVSDDATARRQVDRRDADASLVVRPDRTATLYVASAAGPTLSEAVEKIIGAVAPRAGLRLAVTDLRPIDPQDGDGLSGFYLVVSMSVGGYLVASILGVSAGSRPATLRRAFIRLLAMAVYSVVAGLGGAIIVGPVLHALPGPLLTLWGISALLVFATAAFTMALQVVAGIVGIGLAIAIFVVLGNPSSGGVFPAPLLPGFWRTVGPWITTGAGTQAIRNVAYFDHVKLGGHLLVILAYLVVGLLVSLLVPGLRGRRRPSGKAPAHLAGE